MNQILDAITSINLTEFFGLLLLFLVAYWYLSEPKGLPPGPLGLPVFGYLPFMSNKPHETFARLGQKYGSVFRVYLGQRLIVVLNDYAAIKEAFIKQAETFSGRPKSIFPALDDKYNKALATTDGEFFKDHRRFALTLLRDCGVGKQSIEPRILEEINQFLSRIRILNGKATDIKNVLATSVANNICIMALGKQFKYNDPEFDKMLNYMTEISARASTVSPVVFFPWLKYIPGALHLFRQLNYDEIAAYFNEFLIAIVQEHKKTHTAGQRDHYVNGYITEQQEKLKKTGSVGNFDDDTMLNNMRIMMGAGTDTTTNTVLWGILYLMMNPDVQKKVQDEIDSVIGPDRNPSWSDRLRTPYTEATICEIQRKANLLPINLPHRTLETCEVFGYKIPKGTQIVSNLGHVLNDPKLWKDPENFRPERFLSNNEVQKPEYFIPFSTGKRECLGESLARMELYLYFTSLLQQFTFKVTENFKPNIEGVFGFTHNPRNFLTCAIPRNK